MTPISLRIRELREAKGMTQADLATAAATHQPTISALESDKVQRVDLAVLQRIADALGVPAGMLIAHEPAKRKSRT